MQRWYRCMPDSPPFAPAAAAGGHATLFRHRPDDADAFAPLAPAILRLHRDLKRVFDPAGILNPGRLYADL
jgi:glycolate oxidase FAD binding subunit